MSKLSETEYSRLRENARNEYLTTYTPDINYDAIMRLYKSLLLNGTVPRQQEAAERQVFGRAVDGAKEN